MTFVYVTAAVLLGAAALMTAARLIHGPTEFDRIVAMDVLSVLLVSGIVVQSAAQGGSAHIALTVVIALLGFVGSVTAARLAGERRRS